ncbi:MAG: glutamine amidotransferase [Coriobacteriia bacterium]|nr:glutamine amidotransferase [Coriobacteriia bacterium]
MNTHCLTILNLFPRLLSRNGEAGNLLALQKRCEWRGIDVELVHFEPKSNPALCEKADIILGGGGLESGLASLEPEVVRIAPQLHQLIDRGTPALFVCVSFQLMGTYVECSNGTRLEGAGIFSMHTLWEQERKTGNIVTYNNNFGELIGYENHHGKTILQKDQQPLGQIASSHGYGNNGSDKTEGARYKNALGTYLYGPLLPKNPQVADFLISKALENRLGTSTELAPLPDTWLKQARAAAKARPR